ncbi:DUF4113 domain-containing protein [Aeromonas enteropelogenes]|uniref:DUF4113 domain-containing protein n=1 Tax=Aeromonas enteropelogenes TaxID=29489 RepID=UPI003BA1065B
MTRSPERRHSRWYELIIFNPISLFVFGALLAVCLPAIERWGWGFWEGLNAVRVNTLGGAFVAFLLTGIVLHRFLRYPGASPVAYMIPTVTTLYGALVGILFFLRLPYSRQVLFESYVVALLCCWLAYFIGRRYRTPKYALLPFGERAPYYSEQAGVRLVCPSDDTRLLLQQVNVLLPQIWRDGYRYQKGGVMLSEFTPKGQQQADLFAPSSAQSDALMAVMDQIKAKGLGRVGFASQGTGSPEWMMRQEHLSPCYTTRWEDLPVAR